MGSLAQLAKAQGHRVTGSDANVYPPMSTQLERAGIEIVAGYDPEQLKPAPDLVVVGNAMSRGNPVVEALLNSTIPYVSGPQWLREHVLQDKWVLAVSGTHGKTSTSSLLTWILEYAGFNPGYLIGGVPQNFDESARLCEDSNFFVVEADEYDTAFFDKRSKFVHYLPRTLIINNLEFDHADIFADLAAIQTQFHHLVRIVPSNGLVIAPVGCEAIDTVLEKGCWTPTQNFVLCSTGSESPEAENRLEKNQNHDKNQENKSEWQARLLAEDGSEFAVFFRGKFCGSAKWNETGMHSVLNAVAAIAAAQHVGVKPETALEAIQQFRGVKRRMEVLGTVELNSENSDIKSDDKKEVTVYDDFAHHPTAIKTTLQGLRNKVGKEKIVALIEPRSNTMRMGVHQSKLSKSSADADEVLWYQPPSMDWGLDNVANNSPVSAKVCNSIEELIADALRLVADGGHVVIMSNGSFGGVHQKLLAELKKL